MLLISKILKWSCVGKAAAEIGVAVWQPDASIQGDDNNQAALLHGLYVAPGAQGQGIGRALVKEIAQRAKRCQEILYMCVLNGSP